MKLIALHDKSGKILAAVRDMGDYKGPVPVAGKGTTVTEIEVPKAHTKLDLRDLCTRFRVHTRTCQLVEKSPKAKR